MSTTIPTTDRHETIKIKGGYTLTVRRAKRSVREKLISRAELHENDQASQVRLINLAARYGIVVIEGPPLRDHESGEAVPITRSKSQGLDLLDQSVLDALPETDEVEEAIALAGAHAIGTAGSHVTEGEAGN